jgi:uncharacterized protein YkuJ
MNKYLEITQQDLLDHFYIKDGELYWKKVIPRSQAIPNTKAGRFVADGYLQTSFRCKRMLNHQIAYKMYHGYIPKQIDHIDNNILNNRIENLRESNSSGNNKNKRKAKNNTSGYKNVYWSKNENKWLVQIVSYGKQYRIGSFFDIELADLVATEARAKYHKEFANHG